MLLLTLAVAVAPTLAAPSFVGDAPDVVLAEAAWEAAVACTGREGRSHATVELRRDYAEAGGIAALALFDGQGLYAVRLSPDAPSVLLAHELGHAWIFSNGALGPIEGRTELLAECVAERARQVVPYLYDAFPDLADLTDITAWNATSQQTMTPEQVGSAYAGSLRFFMAMEEVVDRDRLFDQAMTWDQVRAMLAEAPQGERYLAVLDGGAELQRQALSDPDHDGQSTLLEQVRGTDPTLWDSDGDGWWDGAPDPRPAGVFPVPSDHTPFCPPLLAGSGPSRIVWGGSLRGHGLDAKGATFDSGAVHIWVPDALGANPGGYWFEVIGQELGDNPVCAFSSAATVRAYEGTETYLADFEAALLAAVERSSATYGPLRHRLVVDLGATELRATSTRVGTPTVLVAKADLKWSVKKPERMTQLAEVVVSLHRLGDGGHYGTMSLVRAFHETWASQQASDRLLWTMDAQVRDAQEWAQGCGGWDKVLDPVGGCG